MLVGKTEGRYRLFCLTLPFRAASVLSFSTTDGVKEAEKRKRHDLARKLLNYLPYLSLFPLYTRRLPHLYPSSYSLAPPPPHRPLHQLAALHPTFLPMPENPQHHSLR